MTRQPFGPATVLDHEDIAWLRDEEGMPSAARGAAASLARRIGLGDQRASEVALAVSEAATNLRRHAHDGALLLRVVRTERSAAVEFVCVDNGPGIADVDAVLRDGVSTGGTLGIGLGTVRRLADAFDLYSQPGHGTVLAARFWPRESVLRRRPDEEPEQGPDDPSWKRAEAEPGQAASAGTGGEPVVTVPVSGITRPITGEQVCGDAWAARALPDADVDAPPAVLAMLCDGLGHGPAAARASELAVAAFRATDAAGVGEPTQVLAQVHRALGGTRGAAVSVVRVDPAARCVVFAGVGNVSGHVVAPGLRRGLVSVPGIVGHQMRTLRAFEAELPPGAAVVLHTDGLTDRWSLDALPGLLSHAPAVVAAVLLREAGVRRDDAGVVVVKQPWHSW